MTACGVAARDTGRAALAEPVRVLRAGGRLAVGAWAHPAGCWSERFGERLRRLTIRESIPLAAAPGPEAELRDAGLPVVTAGEVDCPVVYPSLVAAWTELLGGEQLVAAIRVAGERAVHDAFLASVASAVGADGTVRVSKAFRYAVAEVPSHVTACDVELNLSHIFVTMDNDLASGSDSI